MIIVDLVFSKSVYGQAGDRTFVRCMGEHKELFAQNGVDLRIITPDLYSSQSLNFIRPVKATWKHSVAMFITKYSALATRLFIYLKDNKRAQSIAKYYSKMSDKGDVVAFQDMIDCFEYLKHYNHFNQKVLLTLHTNGDFWSMWYFTLPKLKSRAMSGFRNNIEQVLLKGVDNFGFVADLPRNQFCIKYNWDDKKSFYVYNGINTKSFEPMAIPDKVKLICVGTLNSRKNQIGILNAIAKLSVQDQQQIEVTFVGGGEDRSLLEAKSQTIKTNVTFTGTTSEVDKYLNQGNLFCLYSKAEGLPISIIEAMRAGLPVIGSRIAGIPELIIDGETGFVVDLDDTLLSDRLHYIINHKELLPKMGEASFRLFEKQFTIRAMVEKYSKVYKDE